MPKLYKSKQGAWLCSVIRCANSSNETLTPTTSLYCVRPADPMTVKWKNALKPHIGMTNLKSALVCAKHFKLTDFQRFSKYLTEKAVPSIFPNIDETKVDKPSEQQKPAPVEPVNLNASTTGENSPENNEDGCLMTLEEVQEQKRKRKILLLSTKATLIERIKQNKAKLQALTDEEKMLQEEEIAVGNQIALYKSKVSQVQQQLQTAPAEEIALLSKCFSKSQIRQLIKDESVKCEWSDLDLCVAYKISSLTTRDFYQYLRNDLKYPLPFRAFLDKLVKNTP